MKECYKCKQTKPHNEFSINKNKKDGLNCECKECQKAYFRQYYATKTEKHKESVKRASSNQCACGELKRKWAKTCQKCISKRSQVKREVAAKREEQSGERKRGYRLGKIGPKLLSSDEKCPQCNGYKYKTSTLCKSCLNSTPNPNKVCECGKTKCRRSMRCAECSLKTRYQHYPIPHIDTVNTEMGKKIVELRLAGFNYSQIQEQLGIVKSTINYHCSSTARESYKRRRKAYFSGWDGVLKHRVYSFRSKKNRRKTPMNIAPNYVPWKKALYRRIHGFHFSRQDKGKGIRMGNKFNFTVQDVLDKYGETPTCYLTGRQLDFKDPRSYEFDHILPVSTGGPNTLDNLGIACPEANHAKCAMDLEDFIQMCRDVINHNGDAGD